VKRAGGLLHVADRDRAAALDRGAGSRQPCRATHVTRRHPEPIAERFQIGRGRRRQFATPVLAAKRRIRHLDRECHRAIARVAADAARFPDDDADRTLAAAQTRHGDALAGSRIADDDRHRVQRGRDQSALLPPFILCIRQTCELEHAGIERAGDRAEDGPAAVALRSANDDRSHLAAPHHRGQPLERAAQRIGQDQIVERDQRGWRPVLRPRRRPLGRDAADRVPHGTWHVDRLLKTRRVRIDDVQEPELAKDANRRSNVSTIGAVGPALGQHANGRARLAVRIVQDLEQRAEARVLLDEARAKDERHRVVVEAGGVAHGSHRQRLMSIRFPARDRRLPPCRRLPRRQRTGATRIELRAIDAELRKVLVERFVRSEPLGRCRQQARHGRVEIQLEVTEGGARQGRKRCGVRHSGLAQS
jgi:hypothetical protein